jgi:hypothetical protein
MKTMARAWRRVAVAAALASALSWTWASTEALASPPECLPTETIDCSVKWYRLIRLVAAFSYVFEDACLTHDLCYRHGATTYGYEKAKCDEDFFVDMDAVCRGEFHIIDLLTLGLSRVSCNVMKRAMYAAVSRSGRAVEAFNTAAEGTCCRYDEFGVPLPECVV